LVAVFQTTLCVFSPVVGLLTVRLPCHGGQLLKTGKFELGVKMDFVRGVIGMWVTFFGTNHVPIHPIHLSGPQFGLLTRFLLCRVRDSVQTAISPLSLAGKGNSYSPNIPQMYSSCVWIIVIISLK